MTSLQQPEWSKIVKPEDDGCTDHLKGMSLPDLVLTSTNDEAIQLKELSDTTVLYVYPMTGRPDVSLPQNWDSIPGARGCTPQSCSFRENFSELKELGVDHLFGLSTQSTSYQKEAAERLHLPFPLLSDEALLFAKALKLPTLEVEGMTLIKRMSMIIRDGMIERVFYPIFPPDQDATNIIKALS